jgi:hypothetical protein
MQNRPQGSVSKLRNNESSPRDKYIESYKKFISGEFSYNSHSLLRKLCQKGEKMPNMFGVPLYKIMIEITKIMMMNELELLFFGATLQEMHWKIV